jgi:hypothetical protein
MNESSIGCLPVEDGKQRMLGEHGAGVGGTVGGGNCLQHVCVNGISPGLGGVMKIEQASVKHYRG